MNNEKKKISLGDAVKSIFPNLNNVVNLGMEYVTTAKILGGVTEEGVALDKVMLAISKSEQSKK